MWPKLSNINKNIYDKITDRNNLEASKLNCWVRLFSGVGNGLIMVSNPDTKLFAAAGEGGIYGFAGNATESGYSGELGKDWTGKSVNPEAGRSLRPSPMVTSLEFSEGEDQISRSGKISLKVFSLEQMELIQQYFMEPGYNVFVEWGWNTEEGASGLIDTSKPNKIASFAANGNLIQSTIRKKALNTNGDYDNMLGFIVGGAVGNDGENFSVEIELRGTPELPSYLQQQNVVFATIESTGTIYPVQGSNNFGSGELTKTSISADGDNKTDPDAIARRFANMFNELPSHRQTNDVKKLVDDYKLYDIINCDSLISQNIETWTKDTTFWGGDKPLKIGKIEIEREKLFSKHKYIRLERALDIVQASGLTSYTIGEKPRKCTIDIADSKIGAFPLIFSTKPESLLISGQLPDFKKYFLQKEQPNYSQVTNPSVNNSIQGVSFCRNRDINTKDDGHTEKKNYWGYLKDLYINQEMLVDKIVSKNRNIREVLYDILNELSSAVNSFWDFQIVEGKDKKGNLVLTVVDRNWVGRKDSTPKEFYHNGEKSRFLTSTLSIDIPGEMASQIISTRLGASVKKDGPSLQTGTSKRKRFFANSRDRFMTGLTIRNNSTDIDAPQLTAIQEKEKKIDDLVAERADILAGKTVLKSDDDGFPAKYANSGQDFIVLDKEGNVVKSSRRNKSRGVSITTYYGRVKEINDEIDETKTEITETETSNVTTSVDKIDIVPNPTVVTDMKAEINSKILLTAANETDTTNGSFDDNFKIYTFKDTNLFDIIKNDSFSVSSTGRLSHPLPIKYSFTILGTSGIRRGDMFNIVGIPEKYRKYGLFQVNSVEHSIEGMKWETTIEGLYRQIQ